METRCRITKLIFNDNTELNISSNDIVVFVGANNCGKSQSLKDIYEAFVDTSHTVVVKKIEYENSGLKQFEESLKKVSSFNQRNNQYSGYGYNIPSAWLSSISPNSFNGLEQITAFFVKKLDTRDRLSQCDPVGVIDRDEPKMHPLHYLVNSPELRRNINNSFYDAFGKHLQVERYGGRTNFLRIGDDVKRLSGEDIPFDEDMDNALTMLDSYPKLHEQGDGMVSFTGVLLSLLIENYSIFLIDEPESFLHPPQARILGVEIPAILGDRQAFISTHSEHLLKGLLEVAQDRIQVVRISRSEDTNKFSIINNESISKIWRDTLLRQSNVLQGLFYEKVVICESDSDCQFYSAIQTYNSERQLKRGDVFFVYSSTKSRMKVIVDALRPLNVEYRVIADLDLLRDINDLKPLFESCGGNWDDVSEDYLEFSNALKDETNSISKEDLKKLFIDTIDDDGIDEYDQSSLKELKRKISLEKKWKPLKKNGIEAIPRGAKNPFDKIDETLKRHSIFLVPNGELEGFVNVGDRHGPSWVATVLERYPDYGDDVYDDARRFVESWNV